MAIFKRAQGGTLGLDTLGLQILIGDMFMLAKDEDEIDWIRDNLESVIDMGAEEAAEELESDSE